MYPSFELQYETYREWSNYLRRFPWEWHATLTFKFGTDFFYALRLFNSWRLRLIDEERLKIGGYLLSAFKRGQLHFHVLLVGRNRGGKCLNDCDRRRWEAAWRFIARIQEVTDNSGACDYVAKHFMGFKSSHTQIESFDRTLLRQVMCKQNDFLNNFDGILADGR